MELNRLLLSRAKVPDGPFYRSLSGREGSPASPISSASQSMLSCSGCERDYCP